MSSPGQKPFQENLTASIKDSLESVVVDLSRKIDDLMQSNKFFENVLDSVKCDAKETNKMIKNLQTKIKKQEHIIDQQSKQIFEAELYSKKYNLKFFNIPETRNETQNTLLEKLADILAVMEIDFGKLYIDNILTTSIWWQRTKTRHCEICFKTRQRLCLG